MVLDGRDILLVLLWGGGGGFFRIRTRGGFSSIMSIDVPVLFLNDGNA